MMEYGKDKARGWCPCGRLVAGARMNSTHAPHASLVTGAPPQVDTSLEPGRKGISVERTFRAVSDRQQLEDMARGVGAQCSGGDELDGQCVGRAVYFHTAPPLRGVTVMCTACRV